MAHLARRQSCSAHLATEQMCRIAIPRVLVARCATIASSASSRSGCCIALRRHNNADYTESLIALLPGRAARHVFKETRGGKPSKQGESEGASERA